ncbi:hypothetical protein WG66_000318, partial [Moniliophthora roreri]
QAAKPDTASKLPRLLKPDVHIHHTSRHLNVHFQIWIVAPDLQGKKTNSEIPLKQRFFVNLCNKLSIISLAPG